VIAVDAMEPDSWQAMDACEEDLQYIGEAVLGPDGLDGVLGGEIEAWNSHFLIVNRGACRR